MSDSDNYSIIIFTVLPQIILVIITAYYAWQTKKMVEEMENARKSQFTPALKVETTSFLLSPDLSVKISNVGVGAAKNIKGKLKLEPDGEEVDIIYPLLYPRDSFSLRTPFNSVKFIVNTMQYNKLKLSANCEDILGAKHEINDTFNLDDVDKIKNNDHSKNKTVDELQNIRREINDLKRVIETKFR